VRKWNFSGTFLATNFSTKGVPEMLASSTVIHEPNVSPNVENKNPKLIP